MPVSTRKLHFGCGGDISSSLLGADKKSQVKKTNGEQKKTVNQGNKSKLKK